MHIVGTLFAVCAVWKITDAYPSLNTDGRARAMDSAGLRGGMEGYVESVGADDPAKPILFMTKKAFSSFDSRSQSHPAMRHHFAVLVFAATGVPSRLCLCPSPRQAVHDGIIPLLCSPLHPNNHAPMCAG